MKYQSYKKINVILFLCFLLALSSCGGGGSDKGGTEPEPPPNNKPVADAGPDQSITVENSEIKSVTLVGSSSDGDGRIVSHQWEQTAGPTVVLDDPTKQSTTFTIPAATESYSFRYTVTDDDGAQGSDVVSVSATRILFSESFENGSGWNTEWTTRNDTEKADDWLENAGQLLQRAYVDGIDVASLRGTYAILDNPPVSLPDSYQFSVDITPLPNNGTGDTEGNDIGIMFRYFDADNYYRVSMNARSGFTRFEKFRFGNVETLAVNAIGYVENQPFTMTADVDGDKIAVLIDGDPVFAVVDSDIPRGTVALYCQDRVTFDNVVVLENPKQPMVIISSPLAYSVALARNDGNTLLAKAVVFDKPSGASVFFVLDDRDEIPAAESNGVYTAQIASVPVGNHELVAILKNADNNEIDVDINSTVGVGGDYYVTVGDSITNGEGDRNAANNESLDGRILGIQGYQAALADLLTETTGRPQIVFNEGIGGDTASDLNGRINAILDRHPKANKVLMMIGTNDAGSGVAANSYDSTVRSIVNKIENKYGKQLWLAKPPHTYIENTWTFDNNRNAIITQYNQKIIEIVEADLNDNTFIGPNFFQIIKDRWYFDDYLHPNDPGYQLMASEWNNKLP